MPCYNFLSLVKSKTKYISIRNQTAYGSKRIKPLVIDKSVLFVDGSGDKIREFNYTHFLRKLTRSG
jgi:hypothetical protein